MLKRVAAGRLKDDQATIGPSFLLDFGAVRVAERLQMPIEPEMSQGSHCIKMPY